MQYQKYIEQIIFSKSFRRLTNKTQLFPTIDGDHFRTRMSHTLEVVAISKRIVKEFNKILEKEKSSYLISEGLTEAIALAHDLGHTPFGHIGERTIADILSHKDTLGGLISSQKENDYNFQFFKHNIYSGYLLLNKTNEYNDFPPQIIDGVIKHTKIFQEDFKDNGIKLIVNKNNELDNKFGITHYSDVSSPYTIEGQIVAMADEIAQRSSDFDDTIRSRYINKLKQLIDFDKVKEMVNSSSSQNEQLIQAIKEALIEGLKCSFTKILRENTEINFSFLKQQNIVNFYGEIRNDFCLKYKSEKSNKQNRIINKDNYEKYKKEQKNEIEEIQNKLAHNLFTPEEEKIFKPCLANYELNELSSIITKEFRIRTFDSESKHVIRQIFKAFYNDFSQMNNKNIKNLIKDIKDYLKRKVNLKEIINEIQVKGIIDEQQLKQFNCKTLNGLFKKIKKDDFFFIKNNLLIKNSEEYNIINIKNMTFLVNLIKKIDRNNVGEYSQKLHNMFLKHIAYSIADMTDDFAIKTYNELYGIKN